MKTKKFKIIPKFKSEDAERKFWDTHDSTEYIDWSKAMHVTFPNLRMTSKPITLRITISMLDRLKERANSLDVPYQSLMKIYLEQGLQKQLNQAI
jgi:predicted DNA binding CopG/RHH family protein